MPICLNFRASTNSLTGAPSTLYAVQDMTTYSPTTGPVLPLNECKAIVFTGAEYAQSMMLAGGGSAAQTPFSSATASQFFGFAFAMTVGIWWVAHGVGQVLQTIRRTRF